MPEQTYTISDVSTKPPESWSFQKDGQDIKMLTYLIKVQENDTPLRLFRGPKSQPPKQGDTFTGEIVNEDRGPRLKVKQEPRGRGGQAPREDSKSGRASMAVKTAYEEICAHTPPGDDDKKLFRLVTDHAKFLFRLATELAES